MSNITLGSHGVLDFYRPISDDNSQVTDAAQGTVVADSQVNDKILVNNTIEYSVKHGWIMAVIQDKFTTLIVLLNIVITNY